MSIHLPYHLFIICKRNFQKSTSFALYLAENDIEWGIVIGEMVGGLSLFMYGIKLLSKSMKVMAGNQLKDLLATLSLNQIIGKSPTFLFDLLEILLEIRG
jgi:hypothetical protein